MRPHRFRLEITLLVLLKLGLIYLIKVLYFSHPLAQNMHVAPSQVDRHFFGTAVAPKS